VGGVPSPGEVPPVGGGGIALDLSPILGLIVLAVAQYVVVSLLRG